jgi:Cytochrome c7 and related cytochrome c/Class III cytochrome C family
LKRVRYAIRELRTQFVLKVFGLSMRNLTQWALIFLAAGALAWLLLKPALRMAGQAQSGMAPAESSDVFTPAHRTFLDALRDFFSVRPTPVQPIAYTHKVHLANGMECTNCHANVEKGAIAGIPSISLCMTCHQVVATDKPEIKKMAAMFARGEDIPWQRVFDYSSTAHVKFNHAPHIRANVECITCHGDMRQRTVAVRTVDMTMGFCINCHKQKKVSVECQTCHF